MSERKVTCAGSGKSRTDFPRIEALTDAEIAQAVAEDPDAAPLDIDWSTAEAFASRSAGLVKPSREA